MILILAAWRDAANEAFAAELAPAQTTVLTYTDLACASSCLCDPGFDCSTLTLADRQLRVDAISAVVNLLPAVLPDALTVYAPEERDYQAAEMHAWLAFFLSSLDCPVVNRPTPLSLSGPAPSPLAWLALARAAGIPLAATDVDSEEVEPALAIGHDATVEVVAVGGIVVEPSATLADRYTTELARRHGLAYLKASYTSKEPDGNGQRAGPRCRQVSLVSATSVPDLRDARVRRALARLLRP